MFIKIGDEMINLATARSVSQNDNNTINISLMADYDYDIKITLAEMADLFQKAGIETIKITDSDFLIAKNVVSLTPDGDDVTVIYKDGHDETYSDTKVLSDIVRALALLTEENDDDEEEDEENIDIPRRNEVISSDLQEERETSKSALGVQFLIGIIAVLVIIYQLYKSGMIK